MIIELRVKLDVNERLWELEYDVEPRKVHADVAEYFKSVLRHAYSVQEGLAEVETVEVVWP